MEKLNRNRRKLIKGIAFFGAWSLLLWRYLLPGEKGRMKTLLEVERSIIPLGGALVYKQSRIAIIRREQEVYALSLVCTHLGCTVNVTAKNLVCPCHGSIFDRDGRVIKGPSDKPLERLATEQRGDKLVVLG